MTDQSPTGTATDIAPSSRRRWPIYAAAAAVLVLAAGAAFFLLRDNSMTVTGSIIVKDSDGNGLTVAGDNTRCRGQGGYTDITKATQVVVTDASGTVIATGAIDDFGTPTSTAGRIVRCEFTFSVQDVPAGHDFYGVEVARRGKLTYPAERLRKPLPLEIGR